MAAAVTELLRRPMVMSHFEGALNMKTLLATGVAAAALVGLAAAPASAWTLTDTNGGGGSLGTPDPGYDFLIIGSDNGVGESLTTLTTTAATAETVSFKWSYTTDDCCGSYWDPGGYIIDGVETQLSPSLPAYADVGATYTGTVALSLSAGDTYGFYVDSLDSLGGPATIEFGSPTPEPATWAMMLAGFGMAGFALRRRSSRSALLGIPTPSS
jgi:hypothetical protein